MNGHVACPSCWSKVHHKCHICNVPVVTRNIALEKVLESAHLPCTYANLGCREFVSYSQRQVHADTCEFGPSLCPIPGCAHKASSGQWRGHFLQDHRDRSIYYCYGHSCTVKIYEEDPYYIFLGPGKDLFLLVKEPIAKFGNVISLFYVDLPDRDNNYFSYELEEWQTDRIYKSPAVSIKEWKRGEVHVSSLLVPSQVLLSGYKVHVLINKKSNVSSSD
ncbi:E3 ubiquitin-protein ligase SINA-like 10 [Carex rostrata]